MVLAAALLGMGAACLPDALPSGSPQLPAPEAAPNFVDSYPHHGDVYTQAPRIVVVNFDVPVPDGASLAVTRDGGPVATGPAAVAGAHRTSLVAPVPGNPGDGVYVITYRGCPADGGCPEGRFAFRVDAKHRSSYRDLTGRTEVTLEMKGNRIEPANVVLTRGTKVTWINREAVPHFVNTDPHPSHNALSALNSLDLGLGESYSFTFAEAGEWGYHCSAHYSLGMVGRIIVR